MFRAWLKANLRFLGRRAVIVQMDDCMATTENVQVTGRISKIEVLTPVGSRGCAYLYATVSPDNGVVESQRTRTRPLHEFYWDTKRRCWRADC